MNIPISELYDKDIYLKTGRTAKAYKLPNKNSQVLFSFTGGQFVGKVYSHLQKTDGIYLMFYYQNTPYYVFYEKGKFNLEIILEQGGKTYEDIQTEKEEEEEEANESIFDNINNILKSMFKYILIILGVFIAYKLIEKK